MSHHNEDYLNAPAILTFSEGDSARLQGKAQLIVKGQGTLAFRDPQRQDFYIDLIAGSNVLSLQIKAQGSRLVSFTGGVEKVIASYPDVRVDADAGMIYWFSLDSLKRTLKFGLGEVRNELCRITQPVDAGWLGDVANFGFPDALVVTELYLDPVTIDPPLLVKPAALISIEDVATNRYAVPANLTPACQTLYGNISGENFKLDTPDFPNFVEAIEASIRNPKGWCYQKLASKEKEFGHKDETYLRITLGVNQGESPGIPYVVEIWPPGHYSPIHNHAQANAIIRVLHGAIDVRLYPMLSKMHETPFKTTTIHKDDVTWISPRYNQTHQLHNTNTGGPTCITIQCYQYGDDNTTHYKYFDYLDDQGQIRQFTPDSDAEYMEFRGIIKGEWESHKTVSL